VVCSAWRSAPSLPRQGSPRRLCPARLCGLRSCREAPVSAGGSARGSGGSGGSQRGHGHPSSSLILPGHRSSELYCTRVSEEVNFPLLRLRNGTPRGSRNETLRKFCDRSSHYSVTVHCSSATSRSHVAKGRLSASLGIRVAPLRREQKGPEGPGCFRAKRATPTHRRHQLVAIFTSPAPSPGVPKS